MRTSRLVFLVALSCAAALAQSIESPRVGTVLGIDGRLRELHGVAGSFTLGDVIPHEAEATSHNTVIYRGGHVFIADSDGGIVDTLPDDAGPVLVLAEAIVYATATEVVLRRADRSESRYALAHVTQLRSIGEDYIQAGAHALRLSTGDVYLLPQPVPHPAPQAPPSAQTRRRE